MWSLGTTVTLPAFTVVPELLPVLCQVKMLCVRGLQRLKAIFYLPRSTSHRSLTSAEVLPKDDALLKVENLSRESKKGCMLCNVTVDFKNIQLLSQFVSPHTGRIYGRHITGLCGKKQKEISKAIKKAHSLGFMPVTHKYPEFMKDPRICSIKHLD
ncbi:PREDICTED: 28S ribosomal protein S18c, mitochondrial isoform X1 [Poecilia mexicana]|uniref:Small ribosomal subunit protein bS18m n=2 Tax=Poecilia mexicana TaxID=48701 RepID=A0A3B3YNS0_9TELE|nr:PREDICTED: 28S ribosomal protein S18c, mitochondrial isoform X1 [Poecilia mexicana]